MHEQKSKINGTIRSNLHSRDIPKVVGSAFPFEFISKCRHSDYIFNDLVPNRFQVASRPATIPLTIFLIVGSDVKSEQTATFIQRDHMHLF